MRNESVIRLNRLFAIPQVKRPGLSIGHRTSRYKLRSFSEGVWCEERHLPHCLLVNMQRVINYLYEEAEVHF